MNSDIFTVDSFTKTRFCGNPAGVCYIKNESEKKLMTDEQMAKIAKEMNISETAFVYCIDITSGTYGLRFEKLVNFLCNEAINF